MDLISEASNGQRVLAARHVNVKSFAEENAFNATLSSVCYAHSIEPDFGSYFTALRQINALVIWCCGATAVLALISLYLLTLRSALRHWSECKTSVAVVLAVYPMVALFALVATILPRARVLAEACSQQVVMIALYHFYFVIFAECGGPNQLLLRSEVTQIETRVLPCCCWPCCIIPKPRLDTKSLLWLRCLVLQIPIIQGIIYFVILILRAEDMMLYLNTFVYIQPFIIASILSGMWGLIMSVRLAEQAGAAPRLRFLALQLVLLIVKLQWGIVKFVSEVFTLPCVLAIHPSVFANLIHSCVVILEMLLLSIWAWRLYRIPPGKTVNNLKKAAVAVLEDNAISNNKMHIDKTLPNKCGVY